MKQYAFFDRQEMGLEILGMWIADSLGTKQQCLGTKQLIQYIWIDTVMIKTKLNMYQVLEIMDKIDCNEIN